MSNIIAKGLAITAHKRIDSLEERFEEFGHSYETLFHHLTNPFIKTKVKLVGDSTLAGVGGTGYSDTGEVIGTTGRNANEAGYCWANQIKKLIETQYNQPMLVDMLNPYITYEGDLVPYYHSSALLRSYVYFNDGNTGRIKFPVHGTSFKIYFYKFNNSGMVDVYVDGVRVIQNHDTYNATALWGQALTVSGLTAGAHNVEVVQTGNKNASSTGTRIRIEAIEVTKTAVVKNWGTSGVGTAFIYDNRDTLIQSDDDFVLIQTGGNDRLLYNDAAATRGVMREIIKHVVGLNKVPIIAIANSRSKTNEESASNKFLFIEVVRELKAIASEYGLEVVNNYDAFLRYLDATNKTIVDITIDGVHPNDEGYRVMYKNAARDLHLDLPINEMDYV